MAILPAVVMCPSSEPTIRRRMKARPLPPACRRPLFDADLGRLVRLDDLRHRDAEPFVDDDDLAACDQTIVDIDIDRLADLAIELDDGAAAELEQLAHLHGRAAEHRRHLHRDVVDRTELARAGATGFFRTLFL